ncbi:MAG: molybdenum ABC transporter ATP-binding protein [Rhodomicrobiaceae bacterium]
MTAADGVIRAAFAGLLGRFSLNVAFTTQMRGITALFGPSGSGKTTTLRCIAGLQHLAGKLTVGAEIWQEDSARIFRQPHQRSIGYVFQEPSLFPHLSVRRNLLYGARRAIRDGGVQPIREDDVIDLLGLGQLLDRSPHALSGGERQRVAVGRALLSQPRLLLMDEPLAALDLATKDDILPHFEALHGALSVPILYVSHDMAEVERLADHLVLLDQGRVIAAGPLSELEAEPSLPLLRAAEAAVILEGRIAAVDDGYSLTSVAVPGGVVIVPGVQGRPGDLRRLRISASDVSFTLAPPERTTILNCLPARVVSVTPQGNGAAQMNAVAALGADGSGARIAARITRKSQENLGIAPGAAVFAQIKSVALLASGSGRQCRQ